MLQFSKTHFPNIPVQPWRPTRFQRSRPFHQTNLGKILTRNVALFAGKIRRFKSKRIEMKTFQADKIAAADC
jgi:hypothetical protein